MFSLTASHADLEAERRALSRIFSIIMWGELAAWKISAQLSDRIVELEPKLAAASQVHDEARHFYVMHDYLGLLGHEPPPMDFWSRRVVEMTLQTKDLTKKLLGMQLTIETIALTLFQHVRGLMAKMSIPEKAGVAVFQLELLASSVFALKAMEPDLATIGVDPRDILARGVLEITERSRKGAAEAR